MHKKQQWFGANQSDLNVRVPCLYSVPFVWHPCPLPYFVFCLRHISPAYGNSYFSIAVKDKATDLLISLDAQSGDPDM